MKKRNILVPGWSSGPHYPRRGGGGAQWVTSGHTRTGFTKRILLLLANTGTVISLLSFRLCNVRSKCEKKKKTSPDCFNVYEWQDLPVTVF